VEVNKDNHMAATIVSLASPLMSIHPKLHALVGTHFIPTSDVLKCIEINTRWAVSVQIMVRCLHLQFSIAEFLITVLAVCFVWLSSRYQHFCTC